MNGLDNITDKLRSEEMFDVFHKEKQSQVELMSPTGGQTRFY